MTIIAENEINEVVEHRVSNIAQFGPITRGYLDQLTIVHKHMVDILTASPEKPMPKLTVEQLADLRAEVERKFALAKDQLRHWHIQFGSMNEDLDLLSGELDEKTVNLRKETLVKQLMLMKKRADDLRKKKRDIEDINAEIRRFSNGETVSLSEEEMNEVFADNKENVKKMRGVDSARELRDYETEEDGQKVTKSHYVRCWRFTVPVSQNMETLRNLERERLAQATQYDEQLIALKEQYLEKVKIFEQIKGILGLADEKEDNAAKSGEEKDEEDDGAMSDDLGHDLSDDEDLMTDGATDHELDEPDADQTVDASVVKDTEDDVVMSE